MIVKCISPIAFIFCLFFTLSVNSAPGDAPFPNDITNDYHIFSDYYDPGGVEAWCSNYVDNSDYWTRFRGCAPTIATYPYNWNCSAFIRTSTTYASFCKLEFRCKYPAGHPNEGEYNLSQVPAGGYCEGAIEPEKNTGDCDICPVGNPINQGTGNKFQTETDYQANISGGLNFRRYYNSQVTLLPGQFGKKWTADYFQHITFTLDKSNASIRRPDGRLLRYRIISGYAYPIGSDVVFRPTKLEENGVITGWQLRLLDDSVEEYDVDGKLLSITNRSGLTQTLDYTVGTVDGGDGNSDTLDKVTDPFGRTLSFTYNAGRVDTMTDPDGEIYTYSYDANGNLNSVTYPDETPLDTNDNPSRLYHYEDTNFLNALTGITDETSTRFATWAYDTEGRAILSEHAGGTGRIDIIYNADGTTTVSDNLGLTQTYHFEASHGVAKVSQIDGGPCKQCGGQYQNMSYDSNGFVASRTDFNGNVTNYINNTRGLEISRTEAVGTPQERTITTEWHATFRLPTKITEPGKITNFTYDAQGRLLERTEEISP